MNDATTADGPGNLHFDIADLLEEDTESKRSCDVHGSLSAASSNTAFIEDFYRPVPNYEGFLRYDPRFRWSPSEEANTLPLDPLSFVRVANIIFY